MKIQSVATDRQTELGTKLLVHARVVEGYQSELTNLVIRLRSRSRRAS